MRKNFLYLTTAVLLGVLVGGLLYMRHQRRSALRLAQEHLDKGEWKAALVIAEPIHLADTQDLEAAILVARAWRGLGETNRALSALSPFIPPGGREAAALDLAGWLHLDAGDVETAQDLFTDLRRQPEWESHALVGLAATMLAESEKGQSLRLLSEARHAINLALARSPRLPSAYLVLGEVALAEGNLTDALSAAQEATLLMDNPGRAYLLRGKIRLAERQYQLAETDFQQAINLGVARAAGGRQQALAQYHQGGVSRAVSLLENLPMFETPEGVQVARDLASLHALRGEPAQSIDILRRLVEKTPTAPLLLELYELYAGAGRKQKGRSVLGDLVQRWPQFTAGQLEAAAAAWAGRNLLDARSHSMAAYDSDPGNPWCRIHQGAVALYEGNPQRALDYLQAMESRAQEAPLAVLNAALAALMMNRAQQARDLLSQVVDRARADTRFSRTEALTLQHIGDLKGALAALGDPRTQEDYWLRVQLLLRAHRFDEAEEILSTQIDPRDPSYFLVRAVLAIANGRTSEAERYISQLPSTEQEVDPSLLSWADLLRAYCAVAAGQRGNAREILSRLTQPGSLMSDPARALAMRIGEIGGAGRGTLRELVTGAGRFPQKTPFTTFESGLELERAGRREEAIALYRASLEKTPSFVPAIDRLAYLLWQTGNLGEAARHYTTLLELGCRPDIVRRNLAALSWQQGDTSAAEALLVEAEKVGRVDDNVRLERCVLELRSGRLEAARDVLASFEDRTGAASQAARGYIAVSMGRWEEADRLLEQAAAGRPADAWVRINRGIALVHLERYAEAEEAFREAVEINPALPEAHRLLGQLYASQGLYREAHLSLSTSLRLNPQQPRIRKLVEKINGWIGAAGA